MPNHKYRTKRQKRLARKRRYEKYAKSIKGRFHFAKWNAVKRRHHKWAITLKEFEDLVLDKNCYYCNGPLNIYGSSLDRVDNEIGYEMGNVVPCCIRCNKIKSDVLTHEEAKIAIMAIEGLRQAKLLKKTLSLCKKKKKL